MAPISLADPRSAGRAVASRAGISTRVVRADGPARPGEGRFVRGRRQTIASSRGKRSDRPGQWSSWRPDRRRRVRPYPSVERTPAVACYFPAGCVGSRVMNQLCDTDGIGLDGHVVTGAFVEANVLRLVRQELRVLLPITAVECVEPHRERRTDGSSAAFSSPPVQTSPGISAAERQLRTSTRWRVMAHRPGGPLGAWPSADAARQRESGSVRRPTDPLC
jgi:hypothetical protein